MAPSIFVLLLYQGGVRVRGPTVRGASGKRRLVRQIFAARLRAEVEPKPLSPGAGPQARKAP
jgi:hypothetical protein